MRSFLRRGVDFIPVSILRQLVRMRAGWGGGVVTLSLEEGSLKIR
jgi:hypothetical protein